MSEAVDLDYLRKAAKCIYIAVDATVADDIAKCLNGAVDEIATLRAAARAAREALEQIVRKDKRYEENCTSQDTGYDGPCARTEET